CESSAPRVRSGWHPPRVVFHALPGRRQDPFHLGCYCGHAAQLLPLHAGLILPHGAARAKVRAVQAPVSLLSMSFFAILFALLIEQARPLARSNPMHAGLRAWALSINRNFDAGSPQHAWVAWTLGVLLPPLAVLGVYWALLHFIGWPLALVWNVAVLYVTLGFRQFSHHFTGIRDALEEGDAAGARARLAQWKQVDASELPRSEIVRHVIEYSVIAAHRHVFGVLAWYSVLAALGLGPAGVGLYRLAEVVSSCWGRRTATAHPASAALQRVAAEAGTAIDWLMARLTAMSFAVVSSFAEDIEGWRFHAQRFPSDNDG